MISQEGCDLFYPPFFFLFKCFLKSSRSCSCYCLTFRNAAECLHLLQSPFLTDGLKIKPWGFPQSRLTVISTTRLSRQGKDAHRSEEPLVQLCDSCPPISTADVMGSFTFLGFFLILLYFYFTLFYLFLFYWGKNTSHELYPLRCLLQDCWLLKVVQRSRVHSSCSAETLHPSTSKSLFLLPPVPCNQSSSPWVWELDYSEPSYKENLAVLVPLW